MLDKLLVIIYLSIIITSFIPPVYASFESNDEAIAAQNLYSSERPQAIKEEIQKRFNSLQKKEKSYWRYNGQKKYFMLGIDDHELVRTIIANAQKKQTDFYFLDIGAGNFKWGRALAKYLKNYNIIPEGKVVHIISVIGEKISEVAKHPSQSEGNCKIYELGEFKIEDIDEELQKRFPEAVGKIDFATSRWTLRHFVEPAGTLKKIYDVLSQETGLLVADGFFFLYEDQLSAEDLTYNPLDFRRKYSAKIFNDNMHQLLHSIGAPYLIQPFNNRASLNHFAIKKIHNKSVQLPRYIDIETFNADGGVGSKLITRLERHPAKAVPLYLTRNKHTFHGDKRLFDWFNGNKLLKIDPDNQDIDEYDVIRWESGIGAYQWHRDPSYCEFLRTIPSKDLEELGIPSA